MPPAAFGSSRAHLDAFSKKHHNRVHDANGVQCNISNLQQHSCFALVNSLAGGRSTFPKIDERTSPGG